MGTTLGRLDFAAMEKFTTVEFPELGGSFRLRSLIVNDIKYMRDGDERDLAKQLAFAIVDDAGERIYTTDEDIENLRRMPLTIFQPLINALNALHGIGKAEVSEIVKNSEASQTIVSASV